MDVSRLVSVRRTGSAEVVSVNTPAELYLDLMKKSLSFALWPEPLTPVELSHRPLQRMAVSLFSRVLARRGWQLAVRHDVSEKQREEGSIWPGYADTMIGMKRLDNLQACIETVLRDGIEGDLIETGVWRGGACIFMRAVLAAYGVADRRIYVADSFEGLPMPRLTADAGDIHHTFGFLAVSQQEVEQNFRRYGLLDDRVVFLKGWFRDTLPAAPIRALSILRLDGDMYESTLDGLTNLYPKLSSGGFCIVDDYGLEGCENAVNEYRRAHGIAATLQQIDSSRAVCWRKTAS